MRHDKLEKEMNLMLLLTENHRYDVDAICDRIGISRRMLYYYLESFRDWGFKVEKSGKIYSLDRESPFFKHLFETINFTEMITCGSVAAAKEKGLLRSEGKDYVVQDGDMIYFRFNV